MEYAYKTPRRATWPTFQGPWTGDVRGPHSSTPSLIPTYGHGKQFHDTVYTTLTYLVRYEIAGNCNHLGPFQPSTFGTSRSTRTRYL